MLRLARSFRFAVAGLAHLLRTQRNFRIELVLGAIAVALGVWSRLTPAEWAALAVVIALVLALEGLNTSLELVVDLAPLSTPRPRPPRTSPRGWSSSRRWRRSRSPSPCSPRVW